jgi:hypothetical protein
MQCQTDDWKNPKIDISSSFEGVSDYSPRDAF